MDNTTLKIMLKKFALHIIALVGYCAFLPLWPGRRKSKLVILRYHSVSDFRRHEVNVKIKSFKKQMEFLHRYFSIISLQEALKILKEKKRLPRRAAVVTFDDGYEDNYTNAFPVLKESKIPALIFLTAGFIGTRKIMPHDAGDNPAYNYLLSWNQVMEMAHEGITFGSHTLTHANLGANWVDVNREIRESKQIIEKRLNGQVWAISYPFGLRRDFNQEVKRLSERAGYTCACSAMNGANGYRSDIFALKRIGIEASDTMFTFRAKLNGALDLLEIKDWPVFNWLLRLCNKILGV